MNTLMRSFPHRADPYYLDVVRGKISGVTPHSIFGYNGSVSAETTLWNQGGIYVYPSTAIFMTISSTSDNDTELGSGARTLFVEGLGEGYVAQTEAIILNGKTGRTTIKKWLRVFRITVLTGGTVDGADGNIYIGVGTLTQGVPATVYARVCHGYNRSCNGMFTTPAGYTGYVLHTRYTVGAGKEVIIKALAKPEGGVWILAGIFPVYQNSIADEIILPFKVLEKTDIEVRASAQVAVEASAGFRFVLVENEV